ncbi:unnamed protein product, partial [Prorocentrum cordatum]
FGVAEHQMIHGPHPHASPRGPGEQPQRAASAVRRPRGGGRWAAGGPRRFRRGGLGVFAEGPSRRVMDTDAAERAFLAIELSAPVSIVSHGGCPDGAAAAVILGRALRARNPAAELHFVEQRHSTKNSVGITAEGATVIFVDISPNVDDVPVLRRAKQVIVIDHHASEVESMERVRRAVPSLLDFSVCNERECGTSLAQAFVGSAFCLDEDILQAVWQSDVFMHQVPERCADTVRPIMGWLLKDGQGNTSIELMEQLVDGKASCLERGARLVQEVEEHTEDIFGQRRLVHESPELKVMLVDIPPDRRKPAVDLQAYQRAIDTLQSEKPTIFATLDRFVLPSGNWYLGLRRAGEGVDVGAVAKLLLHEAGGGFVSGGGHPFAAGAQHSDPAVAEGAVVAAVVAAARRASAARAAEPPPLPAGGWPAAAEGRAAGAKRGSGEALGDGCLACRARVLPADEERGPWRPRRERGIPPRLSVFHRARPPRGDPKVRGAAGAAGEAPAISGSGRRFPCRGLAWRVSPRAPLQERGRFFLGEVVLRLAPPAPARGLARTRERFWQANTAAARQPQEGWGRAFSQRARPVCRLLMHRKSLILANLLAACAAGPQRVEERGSAVKSEPCFSRATIQHGWRGQGSDAALVRTGAAQLPGDLPPSGERGAPSASADRGPVVSVVRLRPARARLGPRARAGRQRPRRCHAAELCDRLSAVGSIGRR